MTPRRTHITLAALAIASLVIGVVALRLLSGVPERSAAHPDIARYPRRQRSRRVARRDRRRQRPGRAASCPGCVDISRPNPRPSPPAGTMALFENPEAWSSPNGATAQAQADAPLPPKRPADLASRESPPATPLPPPRPAGLTKDGEAAPPREQAAASPLAQEPAAVATPAEPAVANVPLPPTRPRALAALTPAPSASAPESSPVPPAPIPAAPVLAAPAPLLPPPRPRNNSRRIRRSRCCARRLPRSSTNPSGRRVSIWARPPMCGFSRKRENSNSGSR